MKSLLLSFLLCCSTVFAIGQQAVESFRGLKWGTSIDSVQFKDNTSPIQSKCFFRSNDQKTMYFKSLVPQGL
ncbi:MAG: hypothetical protein AAF847_18710 [Bacteroidota bacterium]